MDARLSEAFNGLDLNSNKPRFIDAKQATPDGSNRNNNKAQQLVNLTASLDTLITQISELEKTYQIFKQDSNAGSMVQSGLKASHNQRMNDDSMAWIDNDIYNTQKKI